MTTSEDREQSPPVRLRGPASEIILGEKEHASEGSVGDGNRRSLGSAEVKESSVYITSAKLFVYEYEPQVSQELALFPL